MTSLRASRGSPVRRPLLETSLLIVGLLDLAPAHAEERPAVRPSLLWAAPQILPSPGVLVADGRVTATLGIQLTPVLYSFGTHARNRWRSFVVAPMQREGGSLALIVRPELLFGRAGSPLAGRAGLSAHLPLREAGDTLSWSYGVSYLLRASGGSAWGEIGVHSLFGVFGLVLRATPALLGTPAVATELHVRYF